MRYLVALFVAGVIITCGYSFYAFTKTSIVRLLLSEARQADTQDDATRDRIASLERGEIPSGSYEVPPSLSRRLAIANALARWHRVLIPVVIAGCLAIAYATPQRDA